MKIFFKYKNLSKPAKASLWFVICSIFQKGVAFITTPLFTRLLTTEEYGIVSVYNSWLSIMTIIATLELATGVFNKAMIKYKEDRDGYTSATLFLAFLTSTFCFLIYIIIKDMWNKVFGLNTFMMCMMFIDIIATLAISFWSIRNKFEYNYKSVVWFTLLSNVGGTVLSLVLVIINKQHRSEYRVLGTVLFHVFFNIILYILIFKKGKKFISIKYWKYAVTYNLPLIPHYLSQQILNQSNRIMIKNMCGATEAAIFSVAYQIAIVLNILLSAIHASFSPWAFTCIKEGKEKRIGERTLQIEIGICLLSFIFSLFAPEIVYFMGGEEYSSAIWIIPPICMSIVFNTLYSFIANIAFYFEKTFFIMIGTIISAIANIILNLLLIPRFGFIASGYSTLLCYLLYSIIHYVFMKKICKENSIENPFNGKKIWGVAVIACLLSVISTFLYFNIVLRYSVIICSFILMCIYRNKIILIIKKLTINDRW